MDPTDQTAPRHYLALQHEDDGSSRTLGEVALDAQGRITIVSAVPEDAEQLGKIMTRMNNKPVLHADVPAPADAPRFTLASRLIQRGDPAFQAELLAQLTRYYDIELRPL